MIHDLRIGLRRLLKTPGFSLVAVLTLSLGIGAATLVFSWIRSILVETIPGAREPDRLTVLVARHSSGSITETLSIPDLQDLGTATNVFAGILGSQFEATTLRVGEEVEWIWGQSVTANYFSVLGVSPILGRVFQEGEDRAPRGHPLAVISERLWLRRFHGDPGVVGRTVEISRRPFTIIGVVPGRFRGIMGGLSLDLWFPVTMSNEFDDIGRALTTRGWRWLHTVARLQPGITHQQAQAAVDALMRPLEKEYRSSNAQTSVAVLPVWKSPWGAQGAFRPLLLALAGVAGLLLVLVIANLANLLIARVAARHDDLAIRTALGASRSDLIRHLVLESLILAAAGAAGGALLARVFSRAVLWLMPNTYLPIGLEFPIDATVLGFAMVMALGCGLVCGWFPAWYLTRRTISDRLKSAGRGGDSGPGTQRLRQALVVGEIAVATALLVGMALCARSFERARHLEVGLRAENVWIAGFRLPPGAMSLPDAREFYRRLRTDLAALPGVTSAALADWLPLGFEGGSHTGFTVPGYDAAPGEWLRSGVANISADYFASLGIPLVSGREFDHRDGPEAPPVIIVNEEFARRYFGGRDAVGRTLQLGKEVRTIIGVARTGKYQQLNEAPRPFLWRPIEQIPDFTLTAIVRTEGDPEAIARAVERTAVALDPQARPVAAMTLRTYMAAAYAVPRMAAVLLAVLSGIAVFLSALGVAAVIGWSVQRRQREVGIRLALGAQRRTVLWMFLRLALRLAIVGAVLGGITAALGGRGLARLLVEVSPVDPGAFALATFGLIAVALLAAWIPARRAARISPMEALRGEG